MGLILNNLRHQETLGGIMETTEEISTGVGTELQTLKQPKYELIHSENPLLTPLSLVERQIIDMYSSGYSVKSISLDLGCPQSTIKSILNKPQVREIANSLIMDTGLAIKAERFRLLNSIIEDKIKVVEERVDEDGNYTGRPSDLSSRDVVELIKLIDDIGKEKEKKELGTAQGNMYIQLVQGLME